jgi:hypothetical protein
MKKCTYCGQQYPDEASACAIDGQALLDIMPALTASPAAPVGERQQIIDDEHIKLLAIFHFVVAGLALLAIVFLLFHYCIMSTVFSNHGIWTAQENAPSLPKDFFKVFIWFYISFGFIFAVASVLNFLSGLFLRRKKHRTFSLVVGGIDCLQVPFGTALGVLTMIVLSRPSVRQKYDV